MLILTGKNLGERHREFNLKVQEAVDTEINVDEVTSEEQHEDIEILFRIDVASSCKNLDYILDTLKSGDNLHVTRALKCTWLYDDRYTNIINPNYLHQNIFPYMSRRMKMKMLTTISLHVRNGDRVICFYSYCINAKLNRIALKFFVHTPEAFKMDLITNDDDFDDAFDDRKSLKHFIGGSFALAVAYVEMHWKEYRSDVVHELRFLYFEFKENYLDMLEKYHLINADCPKIERRLGIRISKNILKRYKSRLWRHPVLYTNKLNKSMLVKHLAVEDVRNLVKLLMPSTSECFWSIDFYHSYEFIFNLIPFEERFAYLKNIFACKYNEEPFETDLAFYDLKYYELLTVEERESWALLHIEREEELFGSGNDFIWYKFVAFDKALVGIKRYVFITPDNDRRSDIVNVLVEAASTQEDLTKLFTYYYERHVNESDDHKFSFVDLVIAKHDIFTFTEECWTPFHKLLYSLEVYEAHSTRWKLKSYIIRSMIYHILNKKEFSEDLHNFIDHERVIYEYSDIVLALSENRRNAVIKYWLEFHAEKLKMFLEKPLDDKVKDDLYDQVSLVWQIIWCFKRNETECPEAVLTYMKSNMSIYKYHPLFKDKFKEMNEQDFVRLLKKDTASAIDGISEVMCNAYRWPFRLNRLFRKLKLYFSKDVAEKYLQYFVNSLTWLNDNPRPYRNIKMAVVGILHLGNEQLKTSLLEKYAPKNRKIDHENIDKYLLQIQKAICRLSYQSRPPIPLLSFLKYLTGDYVRYCLPMFNNYSTNLTKPRIVALIDKMIDSPVSIQKHGLRLAFEYFDVQDLAQLLLTIWYKTENVSIRMLLYKAMYRKMANEFGETQSGLYDVLKSCTLKLNELDHDDIFEMFQNDDMPEEYRGDYIETAWKIVSNLSNKINNLTRKINMINCMKKNIYLLQREFLREIIDEHIRTVLYENRLEGDSSQQTNKFTKAKWDLTATYIVTNNYNPETLILNKKLVTDILVKCLEMWNYRYNELYSYRIFCNEFLNTLHIESCVNISRYMNNVPVYQCILEVLQTSLPKEELYLPMWKLKISIISRKTTLEHHYRHNECVQFKYPCVFEMADAFALKIGNLVQELVVRKQFYHSFYVEKANALRTVCATMDRFTVSKFSVLTSGFLTQFKINETHVLAVMLMPKDPPKNWEKRHENALNMIMKYDNEEIRSKARYKFAPECKVRNIL